MHQHPAHSASVCPLLVESSFPLYTLELHLVKGSIAHSVYTNTAQTKTVRILPHMHTDRCTCIPLMLIYYIRCVCVGCLVTICTCQRLNKPAKEAGPRSPAVLMQCKLRGSHVLPQKMCGAWETIGAAVCFMGTGFEARLLSHKDLAHAMQGNHRVAEILALVTGFWTCSLHLTEAIDPHLSQLRWCGRHNGDSSQQSYNCVAAQSHAVCSVSSVKGRHT